MKVNLYTVKKRISIITVMIIIFVILTPIFVYGQTANKELDISGGDLESDFPAKIKLEPDGNVNSNNELLEDLLTKLSEYEADATEVNVPLESIEEFKNKIENIRSEIIDNFDEEKIIELYQSLEEEYYKLLNTETPKLVFEVISDTHIASSDNNHSTNKKLMGVLDSLKWDFPETSLVMNCGDFTNNGTEVQMRGYYNILKEYDTDFVFMTGVGNHDVREFSWPESRERYIRHNSKYMGDTDSKVYYDLWLDGYHFIMLNTEWSLDLNSYISQEQLDWLDKTMAENACPNKPIFVGLHQPLRDTFRISNEWSVGVQDYKIKEILRKYPQTILFTGHLHDGLGLDEAKVLETDFGTLVNVPSLKSNDQGNPQGQLGFHVSVYENEVKIELRDYLNNEWVSEHSYTINLDPSSKPIGKILDVNFDDGTATDRSGYGHHGEIVGDPEFTEGVNGGKAIHIVNPDTTDSLIEANQYVKFNDVINLQKDDFTIMFTYKGNLAGSQQESIVSNTATDDGQRNFVFNIGNFAGNPGLALGLNIPGWQATTEHYNWTEDGKWHAIAAVYEKSGKMTLYVDGKKAESKDIDLQDQETVENMMFNLILGADGNLQNGARDIYIDELKVYKKALGTAEIETTWGPFYFRSGANHITISWRHNSFSERRMEPGYILLDGKRVVDIGSGDTNAIITNIKSNKLYDVNLVTWRKNNINKLVDVYGFKIKTKKSDVNKDILLDLYNLHRDKKANEYTEESWLIFHLAMLEADKVIKDTEATKIQIDTVTDNLALAAAELIKVGIWEKDDIGYRYKNPNGTYSKNRWQKINGHRYYFDENGYMETGWLELDNKLYYLSSNGSMVTGFAYIENKKYYFDDNGVMQTGWQKIDDKWYYLSSSGIMETGWTQVGSKWYYMSSSGAMQTGWHKIDGKWYYMSSSGVMQTGWTKVGSKWYYMNSSGAMQTGWHKIDGKWYYMNSSGAMETGWTKVGGKWYYLSSSGVMQTGWVKDSGKWYYLSSSGAMETGWTKVGSKWYYMDSTGVMQTGWIKVGSKWYYLYSDGSMAANTGIGRYRLGKDGAML